MIDKNIAKSPALLISTLLLLPQILLSQKLNLARQNPVIQAENQVWIGTSGGLYQYNPDDDSFKPFSLPGSNQNPVVKELYHYHEWLWCILDSGLAALHLRLNEWLFFSKTNGLPSNKILGLTFQEDYVWAATDSGAARFDLLIEEWEIYDQQRGVPDQSVNDIIASDNKIWFITDKQFSQYDPQYEKWRHYRAEPDTSATLRRGFILGEDIWLVSDRELIRFNPQLQTQQYFFHPQLQSENLIELIIENNFLWAITRLGLYFYDSRTAVWREFEGNSYLKTANLVNAVIDQAEIWILTDHNVLVWDRTTRKWEILDYASGLSASSFKSVTINGGMVFLLNPQVIEYRKSNQDPWRKYTIKPELGVTRLSGRKIVKNLLDNEAGGNIQLGSYNWSWAGTRMTYLHDYQQPFDHQRQAGDPITKSGERLDIKSQILLAESRTISGFYNNIDYSETMYGIRYHSRSHDFLRELNWGDYRRETGAIPFGETVSVFGSNIWLQAGSKTPRFKRSQLSLKAQTGEQRSRKNYEIYQGATSQFEIRFHDTDYLKNQFYTIPGLDSLHQPEQIWIYVDDLNPLTNTANTHSQETIAGITGDFDRWRAIEDFYIYEKANIIRFLKYISPGWTIVVRYTFQDKLLERVLQEGNVISFAQNNFYYLKGSGIIPYTFQFSIYDHSGMAIPLTNFGLDQDGDLKIDDEWIDYENGFLFFPQSEPFPAEVYDPLQPKSYYHLEASFQTELSIIQLKHRNLVRGSEIIRLDGIPAIGGNDYVLDYTNGTLVFVREGIVSSDTRIELEYEYYLTDELEQLHGAMLNWSPSDNFYLQGDWLQFSDADSQSNDLKSRADLVTLHSEVRQSVGNYDIRVIPGFAFHPAEKSAAAANFEGLVSSSKLRFQALYQNYSPNYRNLYRPQSMIGEIKSNLQFTSTVDVRNDLRLSGEWKNSEGYSNNGSAAPTDQSSNITLLFHRKNLPGWQLSYQNFTLQNDAGLSTKNFVQSRLEYQLPAFLSRKILLQGLKIEAFLRSGQQAGLPIMGSEKTQFFQGYFRLNTIIHDRFQGSFFYRRNDLQDLSCNHQKNPISRSERLLLDLAHEAWRLIQFNLRVENKVDQYFYNNSILKNVNLNQYSQLNLRFSPGQLWQFLAPLFFEFNISQSGYGSDVTAENASSWIWNFSGRPNQLTQGQFSRNFFIKNEFRPGAQWLIYSLIERNQQESQRNRSSLQNHSWRWTEKFDVKLGFKTRLNVQYRQFYQKLGYDRTDRYFEPSTWIEHRWTPDFQNTLYLLYRFRQDEAGRIQNNSHSWETRYDLVWRKQPFLGIQRWEIRQSFTGNHRQTYGDHPERSYQLTSSSSLDLYPLHSMILRLRVDLGQVINEIVPEYGYLNLAVNLKVTLRL